LGIRYGILIPGDVKIGRGLHIGHPGGIVVHPAVTIGANCNLSHGVTIGMSSRGGLAGCPAVGNDVYIGPGAKVFGRISIGNGVAIGANAVVTRDVPPGAVVAGIPARVISGRGSDGYVCNTDYD
jgi:serine O-acetyltransferase